MRGRGVKVEKSALSKLIRRLPENRPTEQASLVLNTDF